MSIGEGRAADLLEVDCKHLMGNSELLDYFFGHLDFNAVALSIIKGQSSDFFVPFKSPVESSCRVNAPGEKNNAFFHLS